MPEKKLNEFLTILRRFKKAVLTILLNNSQSISKLFSIFLVDKTITDESILGIGQKAVLGTSKILRKENLT